MNPKVTRIHGSQLDDAIADVVDELNEAQVQLTELSNSVAKLKEIEPEKTTLAQYKLLNLGESATKMAQDSLSLVMNYLERVIEARK